MSSEGAWGGEGVFCTFCWKMFVRQHERDTHQDSHACEKVVCGGHLKDGGRWGCDSAFERPEALGTHFKSEAGRLCIKPLLDEEAMEIGKGEKLLPLLSVSAQGQYLPLGLVEKYPSLAKTEWPSASLTVTSLLLRKREIYLLR